MSGYVLSEDAVADLEEIWDFIALDSPEAADRWIESLFRTFERIGRTPALGHTRTDLTAHPVLFRPLGSYLVIYCATESLVQIVAVTQGDRDIPSFLRGRPLL